MSIKFSPARWDDVRDNHKLFWNNELHRHLVYMKLIGREPSRAKPNSPLLTQANCDDFSLKAEDLIDRIDYELGCVEYLGDSFPEFNMSCFGPGVMAAFIGATLDNSTSQVWFHPKDMDMDIRDIHFEYNPNNNWVNRIKDIYTAGMKRWQGQVQLGMPDLGGSLDVLATFRPGEKLLLDLYDHPQEVKRLLNETHDIWFKYYGEFADFLSSNNPGYTEWSGIFHNEPSYMLQCDFCYMIGPKMFREFVLDELNMSCRKLVDPCYHLDGEGQLAHLDMLTEIPELKLIQWVPGDGAPKQDYWPKVYKKIFASGKRTQVFDGLDAMDRIIEQTGAKEGIQCSNAIYHISEREEAIKRLGKYNI